MPAAGMPDYASRAYIAPSRVKNHLRFHLLGPEASARCQEIQQARGVAKTPEKKQELTEELKRLTADQPRFQDVSCLALARMLDYVVWQAAERTFREVIKDGKTHATYAAFAQLGPGLWSIFDGLPTLRGGLGEEEAEGAAMQSFRGFISRIFTDVRKVCFPGQALRTEGLLCSNLAALVAELLERVARRIPGICELVNVRTFSRGHVFYIVDSWYIDQGQGHEGLSDFVSYFLEAHETRKEDRAQRRGPAAALTEAEKAKKRLELLQQRAKKSVQSYRNFKAGMEPTQNATA